MNVLNPSPTTRPHGNGAGATKPQSRRAKELGATAPFVVVFEGGIAGALSTLLPPREQLGRGPTNTLRFLDPSVSRIHAEFDVRVNGLVYLEDKGSTAGTFVNEEQLRPGIPRLLAAGDKLRFGMNVLLQYLELDDYEEKGRREQFRLTVCDPLTGLFNRMYFDDQVDSLTERHALMNTGTAILMLDIDRFKLVNDNYGHPAGDAVLKAVSQTLRVQTRGEDLVARYGGEEFVIAAPVASLELAVGLADRIRKSIESHPVAYENVTIPITASIGVAYAPTMFPYHRDLILKSADLCLYQAKKLGRNRVISEREYVLASLHMREQETGQTRITFDSTTRNKHSWTPQNAADPTPNSPPSSSSPSSPPSLISSASATYIPSRGHAAPNKSESSASTPLKPKTFGIFKLPPLPPVPSPPQTIRPMESQIPEGKIQPAPDSGSGIAPEHGAKDERR